MAQPRPSVNATLAATSRPSHSARRQPDESESDFCCMTVAPLSRVKARGLSMTEAGAGPVERVGLRQAQPLRPQVVPQLQPGPIGLFQDFIGLGMEEGIGQQD